jgi:hypothetical protein
MLTAGRGGTDTGLCLVDMMSIRFEERCKPLKISMVLSRHMQDCL